MDINSLKDNLNKSLADVSTKGIPSANFEPVWMNNITRLNAQNFNARMYPTIASYITGYGNAVFEGSNEQLSNLLSILPGYKVTDTSTSEIHNLNSDLSSTNEADGAYQAVFGVGNITQPTVTGQFLIGSYTNPYTDTLFAIGNGSNDNQKSNALEVTLDGTLKSSKINVANDITAKYITLTEVITDSSNDKYAATKKYVFDKVKTETDRATTAEQLLTTNLNKEINRAKAEEDSIRAIASSAFHFKGSKPSYADLPETGNTVGDVWQVGDKEYAWNGTEWVELGFNIDLSGKQDKFATISHPDPDKTYTWLDITTPNVAIYNSNRKSVISMDDSGLYLQSLLNHVQLAISSQNIKISKSDSISASPLLGIATPVTTEDPSKGITATDLPYQAVNKDYVDTNFQAKLISGTNIKTINNQSLLGSGNIDISGGGGTITVDAELSTTSENPVQNKIITNAMVGKKFGTSEVFNDYNDNKTYKYEGVRVINVRNTTSNSIFALESVAGLTVGGTFLVICKNNDDESFRVYSIRYIIASINVADRTITTTTKYSGPSTSRYSLYVFDSTATEATPIYSAYSHAEGRFTIASDRYAHSEGYHTKASGSYSHAQNLYTIAGYVNQTAMGKYNSNKSNTLLEIGNGTSEQDRSNAFEVYNDGHAEVQTQGNTDNSVVIKSEINNKQDKFATLDSYNKKISLDPTEYDTIGNDGSNIKFSSYTTLHATTDVILDAAGGDVVINGNSPSVSSSKYRISWDSTNEAIKITFKE